MNVIKVKFRTDDEDAKLKPDFEDSMVDLAENLAICMAEMRKWESFKQAAATALSEGMDLLDLAELHTDNHVFKITDGKLEVDYYKGSVH
tara:strand:- start:183 stop:452 length:270 start_codon:yes stop_codon:yes gene_type:complete